MVSVVVMMEEILYFAVGLLFESEVLPVEDLD